MPIFGGYYEYTHLVPTDELVKYQIAWYALRELRAEQQKKQGS